MQQQVESSAHPRICIIATPKKWARGTHYAVYSAAIYTRKDWILWEREKWTERCGWREIKREREGEREREREREKIVYCSSLVEISIFHLAKHTHTAPYYDLSLSLSLSLSPEAQSDWSKMTKRCTLVATSHSCEPVCSDSVLRCLSSFLIPLSFVRFDTSHHAPASALFPWRASPIASHLILDSWSAPHFDLATPKLDLRSNIIAFERKREEKQTNKQTTTTTTTTTTKQSDFCIKMCFCWAHVFHSTSHGWVYLLFH